MYLLSTSFVTYTLLVFEIRMYLISGAVAERLMHRSREHKVPSSIPRLGISVEVTS